MTYESKLESPAFAIDAPNYMSASLQPADDFVISYGADGQVVSTYGDDDWDLSPYAGVLVRLRFVARTSDGATGSVLVRNAKLLKRIDFYFLYGPRKPIAPRTMHTLHAMINAVVRHCNANGIMLSDLGRFDRVAMTLASALAGSLARPTMRLLEELYGAREELGFEILDYLQIAKVRQQLPDRPLLRQTPYIPERLYRYQLQCLSDMLDDYIVHREQFEELFRACVDAYATASGSLATAYRMRAGETEGTKVCPFSPTGHRYCGRDFADMARSFGVTQVIERWVLADGQRLQDLGIQALCKYFGAVQFVGRAYLVNFSGLRIDEASSLRASCLVRDQDAALGTVFMLRGETSKTVDDDHALWITSRQAEKAVNAMTSIARMRIEVAAEDARVPLKARDRDDPRLVTRAYEPWGTGMGRSSDPSRKIQSAYRAWVWRCPGLFDLATLRITESDLEEALRMTPSLDLEKYRIGEPWPFAYHQLRRTLVCDAAGSGKVTITSLQYQMKQQHETMTRYYGREHTALKLNESVRKDYFAAVVDAMVSSALMVLGDDFVSPFGTAHKERKVEFIASSDLKRLKAKAKQGKFCIRENALGVCLFDGYCPYGGIDSITQCLDCDELLADKRKRGKFILLADELELELAVVGERDAIYRESLTVQHSAMRKAIDVVLV